MNYANVNLQDSNVRAAIAMAINKKDFTNVLLKGNGTLAEGPFRKIIHLVTAMLKLRSIILIMPEIY